MPLEEAPARQPSYEELVALVDELRALNLSLMARVKELEEQLSKNSCNSSKPPSSDGFKKTKSLREKREKPKGGQKGHKGKTLELIEQATELLRHPVACCTACGNDLHEEPLVGLQRRQVFDLPPLALVVTEHQAEVKRCGDCGVLNQATFPEGVNQVTQYGAGVKGLVQYLLHYQLLPLKRTQELFFDLFKQPLSQGTLVTMSRRCYEGLAQVEARIKEAVLGSAVIHVDETGCMVQGKRQWLHVCSTQALSFYGLHPKRGGVALRDIGILSGFTGVAVHDAFTAYNKFDCLHALCNAHLLRELRFLQEQAQGWARAWQAYCGTLRQHVKQHLRVD
jgi:transposase